MVAGPAARVHVVVDESLHPDWVRAFARRGVTLWVQTHSNTLAASTLENVARFDAAFIQLRPPLTEADARVFARVPRAGVWASLSDAVALKGRLPGARKVALELPSVLTDETRQQVDGVHPWAVRWPVPQEADVLTWAWFQQLDGLKVAALEFEAAPEVCQAVRQRGATVQSRSARCAAAGWWVVNPAVGIDLVHRALLEAPATQLWLVVGADERLAKAAKTLLAQLSDDPGR